MYLCKKGRSKQSVQTKRSTRPSIAILSQRWSHDPCIAWHRFFCLFVWLSVKAELCFCLFAIYVLYYLTSATSFTTKGTFAPQTCWFSLPSDQMVDRFLCLECVHLCLSPRRDFYFFFIFVLVSDSGRALIDAGAWASLRPHALCMREPRVGPSGWRGEEVGGNFGGHRQQPDQRTPRLLGRDAPENPFKR